MAKAPRNPFKPHGRNFPGAQLPPKPQPKKDVSGVPSVSPTADPQRNGGKA
jgi:hypothetical protein